MTAKDEHWKPIPGWDQYYEVSSDGYIRRIHTGRILRPCLTHYGYPSVSLRCPGRSQSMVVHRIVTLAFLGKREPGMTVNHKDGNKTNNRLDNLEYMSLRDNIRHAVKTLGFSVGSANSQAKLTEADAIQIRQLSKSFKGVALAKRFATTPTNICRILKGKAWTHV